jgi:2',3'-cyclic-nucleotide 2'-phosphodiesterase (5'-nucleotidase family)
MMLKKSIACRLSIAGLLPLLVIGSTAAAERSISLMQLSDVHGHLAPHASVLESGGADPDAGGMAKLATLIGEVRADNPDSLLLLVGDTTHGSAEMLFTLGEAMMPVLDALDIDVFLPGNWDFGWGPRVYRQRFTADTTTELSPNNRTTLAWMDGRPGRERQRCNQPGGPRPYAECHVTKATFPSVAINLYDYDEGARVQGERLHAPYVTRDVGGVRVAILGITSDSVPHQAQAFNVGLRFSMGFEELPDDIASARAEGAELIVVLSELGLPKNVQLVREFPDIDVMFSGHTHERTPEAIVIEHDNGEFSLITEAGEDDYLGRLDVTLDADSDRIVDWQWGLLEASSSVAEDPEIKALVERERETFVSGPAFQCHTYGTNAFPFGKGHTLCDPLDRVVGHTEPTIERFNALEDIVNNANVDAFLELAQFIDPALNDGNSLSTTNGFRFDVTILGSDDGFSGDITIDDLYCYYPIGAAVALAEFSGGRLIDHWEDVLSNVFDPNPYRQMGGWFLGYSRNMKFDLLLSGESRDPRRDGVSSLSAGKRIEAVTIDDGRGPVDLDRSKTFTLASCYPHGNPLDEVCRTSGAFNVRFLAGSRATSGPADHFGNRQLDMRGPVATFRIVPPANSERIFDPARTPAVIKVAPDDFVHPVDALRWYLGERPAGGHDITAASHGLGRVSVIGAVPGDERRGVPVSEFGGEGIVQPTQGAGASWQKRGIVPQP